MALSTAERQARYRARKRSEDIARVERYKECREKARDWIRKVDSGWQFLSATGNEDWHDYTQELREDKEREIRFYDELIAMYGGEGS